MEKKKLLVLGGSYFLGRVFVEEARKRERFEISVLNRGRIPLRKPGVTEYRCDRRDKAGLMEILSERRWDAVVDFCAYTPEDIKPILEILCGTGAASSSSDECPALRYILISSAAVYRPGNRFPVRENFPLVEADTAGPSVTGDPALSYALGKAETENLLKGYCGESAITYTIIRPAMVYGRYNYAPRESWYFESILKDRRIVIPANRPWLFSLVYADDLAKLIAASLETETAANSVFNAAGDEIVSWDYWGKTLRNITGKDFEIQEVEEETSPELYARLPFPVSEHMIFSNEAGKNLFSFSYTRFEEGMKRTYEYYLKGHGYA